MKKAEMSINMIIMAVIAIIILVIIIFLVTRSGGDANNATRCPSKGGVCTEKICSSDGQIYDDDNQPIRCSKATETCCNPLKILSQ